MAYLLKAKKNIEEQDITEFKVKKEKYLERRKNRRELKDTAQAFEPGGAFSAPPILQKHKDESANIRYAEYVGTFSVPGTDQGVRSEFVRRQLNNMKVIVRARGVLVIISPAGIKVTDNKGQSLLMAHAIHRISYCTCVPEEKLFCFLAREPKGPVSLQYCHVFTAHKSNQLEELNSLLGNAFKVAHSAQKTAPVTFNQRIAERLEEQREILKEVMSRYEKEKAQNKALMEKGGHSAIPGETGKVDTSILQKYTWYRPEMSREQVLDYLLRNEVGSFIVRESTTHKGCFTLTVRVSKSDHASGIVNYLIEPSQDGVKIKGLDKEWSNIASLVIHHSIMPELLPVTLKLPKQMHDKN